MASDTQAAAAAIQVRCSFCAKPSSEVEKVIAGNSEGVINLRPLTPGRYNFFDDFNQQNTGVLVVR